MDRHVREEDMFTTLNRNIRRIGNLIHRIGNLIVQLKAPFLNDIPEKKQLPSMRIVGSRRFFMDLRYLLLAMFVLFLFALVFVPWQQTSQGVGRVIAYNPVERQQVLGATIKGRILFLENRIQYAQVSVSFQFRDRSAPVRTGHSSFRWLNELNIADLMEDFNRPGKGRAPAKGLQLSIPEGFAAYHDRRRVRATSPDGVVYRARVQKNKPEADLPFWEEAMRMRMLEAGYHLVREERIQAGEREGSLLELSAADGESDQTYLIAIFVDGTRLIVVESAGEVERFGPRQESIETAIRSSF